MKRFLQEARYACRLLLRKPGFTLLAVVALSLGIGASASIFSVFRSVLLKPLPYKDSDRLTFIISQLQQFGFDRFWISPPEFFEVRSQMRSFEEVGAYSTTAVNISGRDQSLRVEAAATTSSLMDVLGVRPQLGSFYSPAQDRPNAEPVVVLSQGLWRLVFGADPRAIGQLVTVDGVARTVIGVMPEGFNLEGKDIQAWMPLALDPANPGDPGFHSLYLIGRLREGVTLGQAQSELDGLLARWAAERPEAHTLNNTDHRLIMTPLLEERVGSARPAMQVLAWAVVFILLIACANVANLLLARAETRQGEIALRTVLGADRASLLRQFLIESLLLGVLGGALGLLLAYWGIRGIVFVHPESIPRVDEIAFDGRVIGFTLLISFVVSLFVGLPPALHALSGTRSLKDGGQRTTANVARQRLRRGLVVLEVALAVALVIACGLLIRSFVALQKVDPGFKPDHVLSFQLSLPETVYPKPQHVLSFYERLLARLDELPDVEATAAVSGLPPKRDVTAGDTVFESVPVDPQGPPHNVDYWQFATPGYLKVMEIPMVQGRWFTAADTQGTPGVAVINETMAKVFWPGKNPIGQRLRYPFDGMPWLTIIGIARDVKQGGLDVKTGTELYFPFLQSPEATGDAPRSLYVLLRTTGDPMHVAGAVRNEIRRLDATLPAARIRSMNQVISDIQARPRFLMLLVSAFAAVALLLAAVGTYSVLSYSVEQRSREFGVRMALGARPVTVLRMVLIQGAGLVGLGLVLGSAGTVALRRWLASVLFGIEPVDLLTLGSVIVLLTVVAFAACYFPARRAIRIDPLTVLKQE